MWKRLSRGRKNNTISCSVEGVLRAGQQEGCEIVVHKWNRVCRSVFQVLSALGYCEKIATRKYKWNGVGGFLSHWNSHEVLMDTTNDQMRQLTHTTMYVLQEHFYKTGRYPWTFSEIEKQTQLYNKNEIPQRRLYDVLNVFLKMGLVQKTSHREYKCAFDAYLKN